MSTQKTRGSPALLDGPLIAHRNYMTTDEVQEIDPTLLGSVHGGTREATKWDACERGASDGIHDANKVIGAAGITAATLLPLLGGPKVKITGKLVKGALAAAGVTEAWFMGDGCYNNLNQLRKSRDPLEITPNP